MSERGETFDDVVIGSSPLMLMQAIQLAKSGRKVGLIDRTERLGGAWQTARLGTGEDVEIACHLIEVFPGVYDVLQDMSGTEFVPLDAQPIRITRTGAIVPYFNRLLMLASGVRLILGWCRARVSVFTGRQDQNAKLNFDAKLSSFLRHQLPTFFQDRLMKGPKDGFVDFMQGLVASARAAGVQIRCRDIQTLQRSSDGRWHLADNDDALVADRVHLTTSSNLRQRRAGYFEAEAPTYAHRVAVVVDIEKKDVETSQSYVAFWNDPLIARISRIDMPNDAEKPLRFLTEFHNDDLSAITSLNTELTSRLQKARILRPGASYNIVGQVNCTHTKNVNQLPLGQIDEGVWGYYSYGNLAAGVAAWNKKKTDSKT